MRGAEGWIFGNESEENKEHLFGKTYLHEVYTQSHSNYTGRVSVPMLWDKKQGCMVSNESSEIIRMFNIAFNDVTGNTGDLWPLHMHDDIEVVNARIYDTLNNGVYRCGFATTQAAYDEAVHPLFEPLHNLGVCLTSLRNIA